MHGLGTGVIAAAFSGDGGTKGSQSRTGEGANAEASSAVSAGDSERRPGETTVFSNTDDVDVEKLKSDLSQLEGELAELRRELAGTEDEEAPGVDGAE